MDPNKKLIQQLQEDIDEINIHLEENLKSHVPLISEINRHILIGGGKRLRALLFVLCARLCGHSGEQLYHFSSIFEYLHAATLLHDDVIDNADSRRGKSSANVVWGNSASVLVGDFLLAKSFALAVETQSLRFLDILSQTTTTMAEGMVSELIYSHNLEVTEEVYRNILINKTAILISAACQTGAILGKASGEAEQALAQYGLELGISFQLIDDLLDYIGTKKEFGKPVGNDFKEGKITLPLIYALGKSSEEEKGRIGEIVEKNSFEPEDFKFVFDLVSKHGGLEYTRQKAMTAKNQAKDFIKNFPENEISRTLLDLADYVIERKQ
jgi:octaprenyl-diphosphate synthase